MVKNHPHGGRSEQRPLKPLLFPALITSLFMGGIAVAQSRDLRADLTDLNVRSTTEHYALAGTVNDVRMADFAAALEFIHAEYVVGFEELLADPNAKAERPASSVRPSGVGGEARRKPNIAAIGSDQETRERFSVVVLAKETEYQEFTQAYFDARLEHTRGLFVPAVNLLVILDVGDPADTYATLFHEAFHQFSNRHIPFAPMWVNEGLATYYETARPTGGGLAFDRPYDAFFQVVKEAADAKTLIPFDELLSANRSAFYDQGEIRGLRYPKAIVHYAQSYTLCAYILSDHEGKLLLRRYLKTLAAARGHADAVRITRETFPQSLLESLVTPWLQYVNKY